MNVGLSYLDIRCQCFVVFVFVLIADVSQIYFTATDDNADQITITRPQSNHRVVQAFRKKGRSVFGALY